MVLFVISQLRLDETGSDGSKRVRFPLALPTILKSIICKIGVHGQCTSSTTGYEETAVLTLYRRHSEKCAVHSLRLTPAAKRKYMACAGFASYRFATHFNCTPQRSVANGSGPTFLRTFK